MDTKAFVKKIEERLTSFFTVSTKAMFGGHGVYREKQMFGLIANNMLYLKSDKQSAEYFKSFGSEPFTYTNNGKTMSMSYWKVTDEVMESDELLGEWLDIAWKTASIDRISAPSRKRINDTKWTTTNTRPEKDKKRVK